MSVRIDKDFWKNYAEYEELIRKCFNFLYFTRYPVSEGAESAYNFLVAEFFRKNIFERFDAEKEGTRLACTMKNKSVDKKFKQYIFKWAESVMYGLYNNARNQSKRSLRFSTDSIEVLTETSYNTFKENKGISPWELYTEEGDYEEKTVSSVIKRAPDITDAADYRSEAPLSAYDQCRENELNDYLNSVLKNKRERIIVDAKRDGLSNTAVAEMVGVTSSQVANILKSIRGRCSKVLA
jgi:RNA polymerase sigma factor (sigma-70 family)